MAEIAPVPFAMSDADIFIDADDYAASISGATLTPNTTSVTWKGLKKEAKYNLYGSTDWTLVVGYAQDWETPDSLSNYLSEHEGETKTVRFAPRSGGTEFVVSVTIVPGSVGGEGDAAAVGSVTLPVQGAVAPSAPVAP